MCDQTLPFRVFWKPAQCILAAEVGLLSCESPIFFAKHQRGDHRSVHHGKYRSPRGESETVSKGNEAASVRHKVSFSTVGMRQYLQAVKFRQPARRARSEAVMSPARWYDKSTLAATAADKAGFYTYGTDIYHRSDVVASFPRYRRTKRVLPMPDPPVLCGLVLDVVILSATGLADPGGAQ